MGKESKKEWVYVYVKLIHFAVHLKQTQHCKSTIIQDKLKKKSKVLVKLLPFLNLFHGTKLAHPVTNTEGTEYRTKAVHVHR